MTNIKTVMKTSRLATVKMKRTKNFQPRFHNLRVYRKVSNPIHLILSKRKMSVGKTNLVLLLLFVTIWVDEIKTTSRPKLFSKVN